MLPLFTGLYTNTRIGKSEIISSFYTLIKDYVFKIIYANRFIFLLQTKFKRFCTLCTILATLYNTTIKYGRAGEY